MTLFIKYTSKSREVPPGHVLEGEGDGVLSNDSFAGRGVGSNENTLVLFQVENRLFLEYVQLKRPLQQQQHQLASFFNSHRKTKLLVSSYGEQPLQNEANNKPVQCNYHCRKQHYLLALIAQETLQKQCFQLCLTSQLTLQKNATCYILQCNRQCVNNATSYLLWCNRQCENNTTSYLLQCNRHCKNNATSYILQCNRQCVNNATSYLLQCNSV